MAVFKLVAAPRQIQQTRGSPSFKGRSRGNTLRVRAESLVRVLLQTSPQRGCAQRCVSINTEACLARGRWKGYGVS